MKPPVISLRPSQGGTSALSPLSCSFLLFLARLIVVVSTCLVILALWPPVRRYQLSTLLFVCVLFVLFFLFVVFVSGEPKQKQGRGLVDHKLVKAPQ